jgi:CO/xanthine dehydrogenase FAD-binding subunit
VTVDAFSTASTVEEAVAAMAAGARAVAGGTDLVVAARQGRTPLPSSIVAIHRIAMLRGITAAGPSLRIKTLTPHAELASDAQIRTRFTALADAAAIVGSHATQTQNTLDDNVMNASPTIKTGGPLICFAATATLRSTTEERVVAVEALLEGPGRTRAQPGELLVAVELPAPPAGSGSCYLRLEFRRQMEIAIVGVTAMVTLDAGRVTRARVAITALAPTIRRVPAAEEALVGSDAGQDAVAAAAAAVSAASAPISDVRASERYRGAMASVIARRAIEAALRRARGGHVAIPASPALHGGLR